MSGGLKTPVNEIAVIPKIAALLACGKTRTEIAQTLNLGYATVVRLGQKDECKTIVQEIGNSYKDVAKAAAIKAVSELTDLAIEGFKKALKDGNIEAIKTHFKVIGILGVDENKQQQGGGTIQVILPGANITNQEVIDVKGVEIPESSDMDLQRRAESYSNPE